MTKVEQLRDWHAETAIILGSGLNRLLGDPTKQQIISYAEFSEIPQPSVPGHVGRFVLGNIEKTRVIFAQGRVHLYEGYSARAVTSIVCVLAEAGIKQLIVTNAAGAPNPKFKPGEWMMITDHINVTGTSRLLLWRQPFLDLTDAYSPRLRERFHVAARKIDIVLHEGVYAGSVGPAVRNAG